ncbi:RNA dependent RNA polymerase-domain-containing protein [Tricladium varicosporioides]|nr:RNA dependent RNA polymerase-domain-containing protein [Hymenoscyphus varicosporioides]
MISRDYLSHAQFKPLLDHSAIQRPSGKRFNDNRMMRHHQPQPFQVVQLRQKYEGQNYPSILVRLFGLRPSETTHNIWTNFDRHGNITFIEIEDGKDSKRSGKAKIRFSPPPPTPFWLLGNPRGIYVMKDADGITLYNIQVHVNPQDLKHPPQVQSPIKPHISYDQKLPLYASKLHFGLIVEPKSLMPLQTIMPDENNPKDLSLTIDLARKRLTAEFTVTFRDPRTQGDMDFVSELEIGQYDRKNKYMFQIPFGQLNTIYRLNNSDRDSFAIMISLESPPQFYRKLLNPAVSHSAGNSVWSEFDLWYRQTDIVYNPRMLHKIPIALRKDRPVIDIGRWTTYLFEFRQSENSINFELIKQALQDFNIETVTLAKITRVPVRAPELWSFIDHPASIYAASDLQALDAKTGTIQLPFEVRYQLEVCISKGLLNEYNITRDFITKISEITSKDAVKARNILEYIDSQNKRIYDPMTIFDDPDALAFSPKTNIPYYCAYSRKATITPSTVYFSSPTVETTNRILRHYARENEDGRFLRVQFTDEEFEGRINSCADKKRNDELFTRVYRTLYNGIRIGDRHYEFLAFGNSQFRENGAYFFCPTEHLSCDDIRNWMGNFSHIEVVALYAARLGQCFSTTRAINGLSAPEIVTIDDIKRNGYCFTDGVGKISPFLAQMIAAELKLKSTHPPSAIQFRLGGCKGILVVSPEAEGRQVHIRKSQQKFKAIYNGLEVIRCSHYSCASLNRQTITILSALGVPDEVFLDMLSNQLTNYQDAMNNNDLAIDLLLRYIDDNQMTINIATMIRNGFMKAGDPFFLSLLHLWRSWSIKLLKEKAKIIVENGAFVLGCVDETGTLRGYVTPTTPEGEPVSEDELPQIFLQVPDKGDPNTYVVIEGICLVGRNPSLHPGDLRVVQAVNVPALHHLRNVVVFPSTGERDIPSMCSGGDLDGDDYFIIWDKELQPKEWNCKPMEYAAPQSKKHDGPVEVTHLMKFFVRFMKNDSLPAIAHAHLAQSDFQDSGVKGNTCLELAALHSKAVDYVKTGEPAEMPRRLRPGKWPHFMEKRHKSKEAQYPSHKILGQLYDKVESVNFIPSYEAPFDRRILSKYKLEDTLLKIVRQIKSKYDTAMRRIMAQHGIKTEFEVWSTFVLSKPRVGNDYKMQEQIGSISEALKEQFRAVCVEAAGGKDFEKFSKFVAGMYKVTKEELDIALAECRSTKVLGGREVPKRKMEPKYMPLISFPWLFEKELGCIATGWTTFEELDDMGMQSLAFRNDLSHTRKRHGGAGDLIDDFVLQKDGVIVHRGEELDLFRPKIHEEEYEGETDESNIRSKTSYSYMKSQSNEIALATDSETPDPDVAGKSLVGTGVEEVVPQVQLDGFIKPLVSMDSLNGSNGNPYRTPDFFQQLTPDSLPSKNSVVTASALLDLADLVDMSSPPASFPADFDVHQPLNPGHSARQTYNNSDLYDAGDEEDIIEEIVDIEIEESPMEKLARMHGL